ncbi:hypothetical protein Q7P37_004317 [Cladosporium fusiforme]
MSTSPMRKPSFGRDSPDNLSPQRSLQQSITISGAAHVPVRHAHYMGLSGSALRTAIGLTAGLSFLAFGYGQGDIGGIMLVNNFREVFPQLDAYGTPGYQVYLQTGTVIGSWNLGCLLGALCTFFLCNVLGRKGCIIAGLSIEIVGKIVQCSSFSLGQYIVGRVVSGIGNGFIASTIPAWQAECLKTHRRGTLLLVSFGACITLGMALAYWLTYAFSFIHTMSVSWRFPIAFAVVILLPALLMVSFLPESPRYLLLCAKEEEATKVLSALEELPPGHEDVRREVLLIKNTVIRMASGSSGAGLFSMGKERHLHRLILAVLLQLMQQFTGVNLFMQFLGSMFAAQLAYSVPTALLLAAACSTWFFISSVFSVVGIDKYFGRRTLTIFGSSGMCLCMIVLAVLHTIGTPNAHYGSTAVLFLYTSFFSIGWQGMSWLWAVELIPLSIRGPANAISTAVNWLANFCVVITCPIMFLKIDFQIYIVYAVINAAIIPTIYFFYPETGSRSLEEVDQIFEQATAEGNPWFSVVKVAKKEPRWFDSEGEKTTEAYSSNGLSTEPSSMNEKARPSGPLGSDLS